MKDVVCGMDVGKDTKFKSEYAGKKYYFCSAECKERFDTLPAKYVK